MKLRSQRLDNALPVTVCSQAAARGAADAMFAVELDVERIEGVAAGTDGDADAVVMFCGVCVAALSERNRYRSRRWRKGN